MSLRNLEWVVAGGLAGWAAARLADADRLTVTERWAVPALSFTPQAAAVAWAGSLLMRDRRAKAVAAAAGLALAGAVAPRALRSAQPHAAGPVLRVLTANLLFGQADAGAVVGLVRATGADVLFVQELTERGVTRLHGAGIGGLLPHQVLSPALGGLHDTGIFARHPLAGEPAPGGAPYCGALATWPGGRHARLVCAHPKAPMPPWRRRSVVRWREDLSALPAPGGPPVIMAGDFNATLDHAQLRALLRRGYVDAASQTGDGLTPTWGPRPDLGPGLVTIDHVLADQRCAVHATAIHHLAGGDHRALYAELQLPG
jgi:endonuclease/exonuclease/phosphatase (EEP) superfamily protein YafD